MILSCKEEAKHGIEKGHDYPQQWNMTECASRSRRKRQVEIALEVHHEFRE
jgi:hypothetical protein